MINKLERWAWIGGALLAANAGMVNAVGLQSVVNQAVTHVTGSTTLFTLAVAHHDFAEMSRLGMILLSFVAGAALSGFIVQNEALKLGRRYGVALLTECLLLMTAAFLLHSNNSIGCYFASAACGLQNAMAGTYSGAVLRTTHVSGLFTDLGAAFGHWLRGLSVDGKRVRLYVTLIGSFMLGGILGTLLFDVFSFSTLYIPAALTGGAAGGYALYSHRGRKAA